MSLYVRRIIQQYLTIEIMNLLNIYRVSDNYCPIRCINSNELIGEELWDTLYHILGLLLEFTNNKLSRGVTWERCVTFLAVD